MRGGGIVRPVRLIDGLQCTPPKAEEKNEGEGFCGAVIRLPTGEKERVDGRERVKKRNLKRERERLDYTAAIPT